MVSPCGITFFSACVLSIMVFVVIHIVSTKLTELVACQVTIHTNISLFFLLYREHMEELHHFSSFVHRPLSEKYMHKTSYPNIGCP